MITTENKNKVLTSLAELLTSHRQAIIEANQKDVAAYQGNDESMLDRLKVNDKKVDGMIAAVHQAIALNDPEGKVLYTFQPENGLHIENRSVPFGNILIIYESRPDVTIEASITAFKAGNKVLLKGGKEARTTNLVLTDLWEKAFLHNNVNTNYVTYLDLDRTKTQALIKNNTHRADLIIPRGGDGLINFVRQNTNIPIIVSGRGNNFLYVDKNSDIDMAINIILDGKKRISVCNALDKVLINKDLPDLEQKLKRLIVSLKENEIEILADHFIAKKYEEVQAVAGEEIFHEEFLAKKIMLSMVDNIELAISKINIFSGQHSATIITNDKNKAAHFLNEVDCAAVYHNASTRFTDGGQFGFGAEMAISTQKLHFRGPIGIDQLVTNKWFIHGDGQVRV